MPPRLRFVLTVFVLPIWVSIFGLCPQGARAQTPKSADVRVAVEKERISLYDLLNEVNAQIVRAAAGKPVVTLRVDPDDSAAATPVAVFVKEMRIPVFADALAATLTIRKAAWRWIPGDAPPSKDDDEKAVRPEDFKAGGIYTLRPNAAARAFASRTRAQILNDLLTEAQESADGKLTPTDAKESVATAPPNAPTEYKETVKKQNEANKRKAMQGKAALGAFSRLSAAQRESLVGGNEIGGTEITMELGELPADTATLLQDSLVASAEALRTALKDANGKPILKPDGDTETVELAPNGPPHVYLKFSLSRSGGEFVPRLTTWGYSETEYGGKPGSENYSKVGGGSGLLQIGEATERRWRDRLARDWNDAAPSAPETASPFPDTLPLPGVQNPSADDAPRRDDGPRPYQQRDAVTTALRRLSETGKIPLIVRLAGLTLNGSSLFFGDDITLSAARRDLLRRGNLLTRWRPAAGNVKEGVLIGVALPFVWETAPEHLVNPTYRETLLRAAKDDPIGCLPFPFVLDAAKRLTPEALKSLEPDFPQSMENVAQWRPLFKAIAENGSLRRQIISKEGASFDNFPVLLRALQDSQALRYVLRNLAGTPPEQPLPDTLPGARLLLKIEDNPGRRNVSLELRYESDQEYVGQGFDLLPLASLRGRTKGNSPPRPPQP